MADTDLVEWTTAAIATVRAAAEAAQKATGSAVWTVDGGDIIGQHPMDRIVDYVYEVDARVHIGLNEPQAVLDGCDADLAILDEVSSWRHLYLDDDGWYSCAQAIDPHEDNAEPGSGCLNDRAGGPCDCGVDARRDRIVKAVASRYQHQVPGWQEGWAT
jgi:hypothetical protein